MNKKNILLIVVVAVIVLTIWHLESKKVHLGTSVNGNDQITLPTEEPAAPGIPPKPKRDLSAKKAQYSYAKEITDAAGYINTPNNGPITISQYIGKKVILLDFWTYSCINCQRTIPYLNDWYQKYKDQGLVIIGMQAPEFEFEKKYDNVTAAITKLGIKYPVVLDNNMSTWTSYQNNYWPEHYLIDIDGFVVDRTIGEGGYAETEKKIQDLLKERKEMLSEAGTITTSLTDISQKIDTNSPETYFGFARNKYFSNGVAGKSGTQTLIAATAIDGNKLYLGGTWNFQDEYATNQSTDAHIVYKYNAMNVYFVADAKSPVTLTIMRDGVPVKTEKGTDVSAESTLTINGARLYHLIAEPQAGQHTLEIIVHQAGLEAYTFTFG